MLKELLITLWSIEDSEKNWIKKLKFQISFNPLQNSRISYLSSIFFRKLKIILARIYISTLELRASIFRSLISLFFFKSGPNSSKEIKILFR